MKDFEGQRRFNPAKLPTLGEPLQTLDITPQISQAYREKMRMDEGYIRSIEQNEKQELKNLDTQAANAERKATQQSEFMNSLMEFAPSLVKLGQQQLQAKIKEDEVQGKMKKFDMDFSDIQNLPYYQQQMTELEAVRNDHDANAAEAFRRTRNYEIARVYKSLNSAERVGFAKAFLAEKQAEWPAYLSEQMTSNDELEINVGGDTFTPSTAEGASQNSAAAKALYRKFLIDNGMTGMNDFFMEEFFTGGENGARNSTYKVIAKRNQHDAKIHAENNYLRITAENSAEVKTNPQTANGIKVLNAIGLLQDRNGNPLDGFAKATKFKEHVEGLIDSGVLRTQQDVQTYLENTPDPVTGGTIANRVTLNGSLKLAVTKRNNADYSDFVASQKAAYYGPDGLHFQAMAAAERSRADPNDRMTGDEYLKLQQIAVQYTGTTDKRLEEWWLHESEHGQNFEENLQMIKEMADDGYGLTPELVRAALGYSPQAEQYINIAKGQANARQRTGGFSKSYQTLKTTIQQVSGYAGRDSEAVSGKQAYLLNELHRQVKHTANFLMNRDDTRFHDPLQAEQEALRQVLEVARADGLNMDDRLKKDKLYAAGSNNEFNNFFASDAISSRRSSAKKQIEIYTNQINYFNDSHKKFGVDLEAAGAYVNPAVLALAAKTYYNEDGSFNTNFSMPEGIKQLDSLIPDMNQIQIMQKLLETNKIVDSKGNAYTLSPPPSMDPQFKPLYEKGGIDQNILRLYGKAQSGLESIRIGASSSRGFQSARIPPQFEAPLKKVATGAELPFEIVVALVQYESKFQDVKSEARPNGSFDGGPFQTNTEYYPYTPGDLGGNSDNALKQLLAGKAVLEQNGITPGHPDYIDGMLASYNAGQNSLEFLPNGRLDRSNSAHKRYIKGVRGSALGFGDQRQLADNSLIREPFRVTHPDTGTGFAIPGALDYKGRPVVLSQRAATVFDQMVRDSNGAVKYSDIYSAQRSASKNRAVGGSPTSNHLTGSAVDIHGSSKAWIKKHGHKYGFHNLVYSGHDGHFDFK